MVYVDEAIWPWRGRKWAHLMAEDLDELHAFAARVGLKRSWFQGHTKYPHYDLVAWRRQRAIQLGAVSVTVRELVKMANGWRLDCV